MGMTMIGWLLLGTVATSGVDLVASSTDTNVATPLAIPAPVVLGEAEAIARFDLRKRLDTYGAGERQAEDDARVEVVEGDLHVTGDLLVDFAQGRAQVEKIRARAPGDRNATSVPGAVGLVVTGSLRVEGAILNANLNVGPFLLVLGETRARAIYSGGAEMLFEGRTALADTVVGCYNDGSVTFDAGLDAAIAISEDHMIRIRGEPAPEVVDYFDGSGDFELLARSLDPVIGVEDVSEIDAEAMLLPRIRRGERLLKSH